MISDQDKKALEGISERQFMVVQAVFFIAGCVFLYSSYHNISLAVSYGESMGLSFAETLEIWNTELELKKQYVGYHFQSLHRLNMAIINLGVVLIIAIVSLSISKGRKRNNRVLAALRQCGAISKNV